MDIKFLKDWQWMKKGQKCWMADGAAQKLIDDGIAEQVKKKPAEQLTNNK